jgi:hypothetical protein
MGSLGRILGAKVEAGDLNSRDTNYNCPELRQDYRIGGACCS